MLMQSFLNSLNQANTDAQQAERNRQLAEQQRLAEEQRVRAERILSARRLRDFWDGQDRESSASLSSVLDSSLQGTPFFGAPPNPPSSVIRDLLSTPDDPFAGDPNVVDLRGLENPTPRLLRTEQSVEEMRSAWIANQKRLVEQRLREPNQDAVAITRSLKTKAPPLPCKKFDELQPGDVLLIEARGGGVAAWAINAADRVLSGEKASTSSHTVLYLKEVRGQKHFLENVPGEGPRVIFEDEFLKRYGARGAEVAKLAQPLNDQEARRLYSAAVEMAASNRKKEQESRWYDLDKTHYGVWGKDNVVCSEADWALLNTAGRKVPASRDPAKGHLGIRVSPADFFKNGQYFLVSPLEMPNPPTDAGQGKP